MPRKKAADKKVAKQSKEKTKPKNKSEKDSEASPLEILLDKAKKQKTLTQGEIVDVLPDGGLDLEATDALIAQLVEHGIEVVEDEEVDTLFDVINNARDRAMFRVMLRCGLRVEEVAELTLKDLDLKRRKIYVRNGKGGKDRVVYISDDAYRDLLEYLRIRASVRRKKVFLVEKGTFKGQPLSVRGIQKRIEYYARKSGLKVSCHQLRHTMATQMLNAGSDLVTIQDLLGHNLITTTQRYSRVSNVKVQRDYFKAMDKVIQRSARASSNR